MNLMKIQGNGKMGHLGRIEYIKVLEEDLPEWAGKGEKDLDEDEIFFHADFFLEVINQNGETIGLFYLLNRLTGKPDCRDGLEFAHYYDQLVIENNGLYWLIEESDWEDAKEQYGLSADSFEIESYAFATGYNPFLDSPYRKEFTEALISYGRRKYPYGLREPAKQIYESALNEKKIADIIQNSADQKLCEIMDPLIELFGIDELYKHRCHKFISDVELDYYGENADWLLTTTNIDFFIEAANRNEKTDVLAFLLDYKNKHFPEKRNEVPKLQS